MPTGDRFKARKEVVNGNVLLHSKNLKWTKQTKLGFRTIDLSAFYKGMNMPVFLCILLSIVDSFIDEQ